MKLVVILHMFYHDLWGEIRSQLLNIPAGFDLCVSLCEEHDADGMRDRIMKDFPDARFMVLENRGADAGPFFEWMNVLVGEGREYDYLLKLHTKKIVRREARNPGHGDRMRRRCTAPIVGSTAAVHSCLNRLSDDRVGMIGAHSELYHDDNVPARNRKWLCEGEQHMQKFVEEFGVTTEMRVFFMGSMFWCKYGVMAKYMSRGRIGQEYFEKGDHGQGDTAAHAAERLFARFFVNEGLLIVGV